MRWPTDDSGDVLETLARIIDELTELESEMLSLDQDRAYIISNVIEQLENLADAIEEEDV